MAVLPLHAPQYRAVPTLIPNDADRLDHNNPRVYYNLAIALKAKGDLDGAISIYRKAIRLNKPGNNTHNNFFISMKMTVKLEEYIGHYREAM